tara:strand:+ start:60 stop:233 length:174 start_codon:yes stop_codon:yes gene_type:complete
MSDLWAALIAIIVLLMGIAVLILAMLLATLILFSIVGYIGGMLGFWKLPDSDYWHKW